MIATPCHSFIHKRSSDRVSRAGWVVMGIALFGALVWGFVLTFPVSDSSGSLTRLPSNASSVPPSIQFRSVNGVRNDDFFEFSGICRNVSNQTLRSVAVYVELIDSHGCLRDVEMQPIYINPLCANAESPFKVLMPHISGIRAYRVFVCNISGKTIPSR